MTAVWLVIAAVSAAFLLLTWIVYPAIMTRRGSPAPPGAPPAPGFEPEVSLILVTKESADAIRSRLEDVLRTSYPATRLELIVAVDATYVPEGLEDLGRRCRRLVLTTAAPPGGKAAGLNSAVSLASGDVLVFTDTHQRFDPPAISHLVAALARGPWSIVSGALKVEAAGRRPNILIRYWRQERRLREAEARVHSAVGVTGSIYAMWRNRWMPLPAGLILDDVFIPMRRVLHGDRVGFEPAAIAVDTRTTTPREEFRRKVRTLTGNIQLCAWLPQALDPRRNPIWIQFVCHKLLRLITPYWLLALAIAAVGLASELPPAAAKILLGVSVAAGVVILLSRTLRSAAAWGLTMQAAAILATLNGVRGKWDVWRR